MGIWQVPRASSAGIATLHWRPVSQAMPVVRQRPYSAPSARQRPIVSLPSSSWHEAMGDSQR
jgi:hypothetical protein